VDKRNDTLSSNKVVADEVVQVTNEIEADEVVQGTNEVEAANPLTPYYWGC
jgi:hypothetical protein